MMLLRKQQIAQSSSKKKLNPVRCTTWWIITGKRKPMRHWQFEENHLNPMSPPQRNVSKEQRTIGRWENV